MLTLYLAKLSLELPTIGDPVRLIVIDRLFFSRAKRMGGGAAHEHETSVATKPQVTNAVDESVSAKWSAPLAKAGWTSFPNVIFERQQALGLTPLDINILIHFAGCLWRRRGLAEHFSQPHRQKINKRGDLGIEKLTTRIDYENTRTFTDGDEFACRGLLRLCAGGVTC
ncbi:hypothetical protein [Burkholderia cenocepacia]|uniref:hypothetical protein n=1 Tax=Burkholderia cenocepacia TaxID=95486 RepID=UPI0021AB6FB7|nr:hypothetical protein [Burkholderia cenocepacia]